MAWRGGRRSCSPDPPACESSPANSSTTSVSNRSPLCTTAHFQVKRVEFLNEMQLAPNRSPIIDTMTKRHVGWCLHHSPCIHRTRFVSSAARVGHSRECHRLSRIDDKVVAGRRYFETRFPQMMALNFTDAHAPPTVTYEPDREAAHRARDCTASGCRCAPCLLTTRSPPRPSRVASRPRARCPRPDPCITSDCQQNPSHRSSGVLVQLTATRAACSIATNARLTLRARPGSCLRACT